MTKKRIVSKKESQEAKDFVTKACVTCAFWKDKKDLYGDEWKGTYGGRCTKFTMETPPMYHCKSWEKK